MALLLQHLYILIMIAPFYCCAMFPSLQRRFHEAIEAGNLEVVQSLMALEADPNGIYMSRTPLQTAVISKRSAIIEYLLAHGAHLTEDIIDQLLRTGYREYTFDDVLNSLKILLDAGALYDCHKVIPRGYLLPEMLAHSDHEKAHRIVTQLIRCKGMQKIA